MDSLGWFVVGMVAGGIVATIAYAVVYVGSDRR